MWHLHKVGDTPLWDVIVIGAGVQGAGIAQACALNGWRVLVLERHQAAGLETSSNSSKLIHGGLRYLETGQLGLVYECLQERKRLLQNAPHLVHISPFYIPIYQNAARHPWWVRAGLSLYAVLGGLRAENRFRQLPRVEWQQLGLQTQGLKAVFEYFDAQTDDRALTQAVMAHAQSLGAKVHYGESVARIQLTDTFEVTTDMYRWCSRCVVNAAGPWVNEFFDGDSPLPKIPIDWVQGVHIVLPHKARPGCFYLESPEGGRPFFVLPWAGKTLVGTTERVLSEPQSQASAAEISYLLSAYNHFFSDLPATEGDVETVMSGIRVLPRSTTDANARSRETLLAQYHDQGRCYVGVYGGKLTAYRAVADKVSRAVAKTLAPPDGGWRSTRDCRL